VEPIEGNTFVGGTVVMIICVVQDGERSHGRPLHSACEQVILTVKQDVEQGIFKFRFALLFKFAVFLKGRSYSAFGTDQKYLTVNAG
jgi:hypothetical protein